MRLVGLENTRKIRACRVVHSASAAIKHLRTGMAVTSAGDNGAVTVWNDRDGKYRCESMRYQVTQDRQTFATLKDVRDWLKSWLKQIQ